MFRQSFLGGLFALITAGTGSQYSAIVNTPTPAPVERNDRLAESLTQLSSTLVSFESRQTGSERNLTEQLAALATIVGDTQRANQTQINELSKSLEDVRRVAAQESEAFKTILQDFADGFEKKFVADKAEVEELPSGGVGTLNVDDMPADSGDRPQDFAEAARRIVELEKAVKELQSRSVSSTPTSSTITYTPTTTYYPAYASSTVSGGSTGSYSGGSTGSAYRTVSTYTSLPVYSSPFSVDPPIYYTPETTTYHSLANARAKRCRVIRNGKCIR